MYKITKYLSKSGEVFGTFDTYPEALAAEKKLSKETKKFFLIEEVDAKLAEPVAVDPLWVNVEQPAFTYTAEMYGTSADYRNTNDTNDEGEPK